MYKTVPEAMFLIVKKEGFRSLFKGLLPTMVQSAPYGACQFGFYTVFSKLNSKLCKWFNVLHAFVNIPNHENVRVYIKNCSN